MLQASEQKVVYWAINHIKFLKSLLLCDIFFLSVLSNYILTCICLAVKQGGQHEISVCQGGDFFFKVTCQPKMHQLRRYDKMKALKFILTHVFLRLNQNVYKLSFN